MKTIKLNDGTIIFDFFNMLVIVDKDFASQNISLNPYVHIWDYNKKERLDVVPCSAKSFITRKGREAIRISNGNSHNFHLYGSSGDRNWQNWSKRRPVNAVFSKAVATSNGGGCWLECWVMEANKEIVTAEQAEYIGEIEKYKKLSSENIKYGQHIWVKYKGKIGIGIKGVYDNIHILAKRNLVVRGDDTDLEILSIIPEPSEDRNIINPNDDLLYLNLD